jgi:MFS family permease
MSLHLFSLLKSDNYKYYLIGLVVSTIGSFMTETALAWLVYTVTHSTFLLGLTLFLQQAALFTILPIAGIAADRLNRLKLVITSQLILMLLAFLLLALVVTQQVQLWKIFLLVTISGIVTAFDMPTRQALVVQLVESELLNRAIALNSSIVNTARIIGPAIAGLLIVHLGISTCFLIDGVSYLAILAALFSIRLSPDNFALKTESLLNSFTYGLRYVWENSQVRMILLMLGVINFAGVSCITTLLPALSREILLSTAVTMGLLQSSAGIGAIFAAITAFSIKTKRLSICLNLSPLITGSALIICSYSQRVDLTVVALFAVGYGAVLQHVAGNTIIQNVVAEDMRGRITSLYSMTYAGMTMLGTLLSGLIAGYIGITSTIFIGGLICCSTSFLLIFRRVGIRTLK